MKQYNFCEGSKLSAIKKFMDADNIGKRLTYIAAAGLAGNTLGGIIGTLYGVKMYNDKEKTLEKMERKITDPETSSYTRQKLIDVKNLIQSMTDEEYRSYIIKSNYEKGRHIGSTAGSIFGATLGGFK